MNLPQVAPPVDCWNTIGVHGDRSCPELPGVVHCHNCPVFARAGRRFLDAPSPPGYLEEWGARLAVEVEETDTDLIGALVFRLGEEWLALPVGVLVEVATPRPIHRVPHRGGLLAGLVNLRGELHLCVHLDALLGIARAVTSSGSAAGSARARLLVVRRGGEGWALPVEEVDQVHRFPAPALRQVPATLGRAAAHLVRGVFDGRGHSVGLLDEGRLFAALRARAV